MEQTVIHKKKFYKKRHSSKYRKGGPRQQKPKFNLGPLNEDEKKIIRYIRDRMREHKLKSFGHGFVGVHCRSHIGPELNMSPSHARVLLKRLAKRKIIQLKNAQKNPGYEFSVRFVSRDSRQNRYKELYGKAFSEK